MCVTLKNTERWFLDMNRRRRCLEPYKEPSCLTLCDPIDGSPPGSPVPGILRGKNTGVGCHFLLQCMKVKVKSLSRVWLLATPWTAAHQAPPSMGFSRQEYWSGVPLPSPVGTLSSHFFPRNLTAFIICHNALLFLSLQQPTSEHLCKMIFF